MTLAVRGPGLAATLVFVSTLGVIPQAKSQSTAAYVYVQSQGAAGPVYGYSASSAGKLTAISGSPFKPGTAIVGGNGTQFFTVGHSSLHSWAVGSNGAIGSQLSDILFTDYTGGSCAGDEDGDATGVLDRTGKYVYLVLQDYEKTQTTDTCQTIQSYAINTGGSFTFEGDTEQSSLQNASLGLPSILGNEDYAYANNYVFGSNDLLPLKRDSSGALGLLTPFNETDPALSGGNYTPYYPAADPVAGSSSMVVELYPNNETSNPPQLASYTVDAQGNISTTNTSSNMPTSKLLGPYSVFSPDGKFVALYSGGPQKDSGVGAEGLGIEIYNFNGAAPLTLDTSMIPGVPIDGAAWDTSGHLYAISTAQNLMYVFNVSAAGVTVDPTVSISSPVNLAVVSQATTSSGPCTAPNSAGVNVCAPGAGASVTSPVEIEAAATVSGGVYRFEVWNGNTKLLSSDSGTIDQTLSLAAGSYTLTFDAYNSSKTQHEYASRSFTVK